MIQSLIYNMLAEICKKERFAEIVLAKMSDLRILNDFVECSYFKDFY